MTVRIWILELRTWCTLEQSPSPFWLQIELSNSHQNFWFYAKKGYRYMGVKIRYQPRHEDPSDSQWQWIVWCNVVVDFYKQSKIKKGMLI